jgi:hypothetical protein
MWAMTEKLRMRFWFIQASGVTQIIAFAGLATLRDSSTGRYSEK